MDEQQETKTIAGFLSPLEDSSDTYREPFKIQKYIYNYIFSIDDLIKDQMRELAGMAANNNIITIASEKIILCSRPSHKIVYKQGDLIYHFIYTLEQNVTGNGMTSYGLVSAIKAGKYEKFLPIINRMINSFEIL